jgi:hypothetical protein
MFAELEPHLRRAEAAIRTRMDRTDDLSPFHCALLEAGPRTGLPRLADINGAEPAASMDGASLELMDAVRGRGLRIKNADRPSFVCAAPRPR